MNENKEEIPLFARSHPFSKEGRFINGEWVEENEDKGAIMNICIPRKTFKERL